MTLRDNLEDVAFEPGLGIRSFARRSFAHFARRSFAHFAQIKSATNLAFSLFYVRFKKKLKKLANRSFLLTSSFLMSDVSESLIPLKSNEQCERIAQVAHQKGTTMSDSLRSLTKNERMSESLIRSFSDKIRAIPSEIK